MDRAPASGAGCVSSILTRRTIQTESIRFKFYYNFILKNCNIINKFIDQSAEIIRAFCFYGLMITFNNGLDLIAAYIRLRAGFKFRQKDNDIKQFLLRVVQHFLKCRALAVCP